VVKRVSFVRGGAVITPLKLLIDRLTVEHNDFLRSHRAGRARTLYASDYGQCMRKVWFQFFPDLFPVGELDSRVLRIFHNGEAVHDRLSAYLRRELSLDFVDELDVPRDSLDVHGRCDGVCVVDNQAVVVEFKSINRSVVSSPKPEHVGQLLWYMAMWRLLREQLRAEFRLAPGVVASPVLLSGVVGCSGRTVDSLSFDESWVLFTSGDIVGELIYESKQTQETFHFPVLFSEDKFSVVRSWFESLKSFVDSGVMPVVSYDRSRFPCSWGRGSSFSRCPYFDICHK
jgi:hypothetical protein